MKRFLSFVLTLCLLAGMGMTAFADETELTPIKIVEISVPDFAVGDAITTDGFAVSAGRVTHINWINMTDGGVVADGVFEMNKTYCLDVIVHANEGEYFSDPEYIFNGGEDFGTVYGAEDSINILFYVDFSLPKVYHAEILGEPEDIAPGAAQAPEMEVTFGDVTITGVQWVNEEKQPVTTIEDGKCYYLEVSLAPAAGFSFGEYLEVYGKFAYGNAEIAEDFATAKVYFYYSLRPQVEKVELTVSGVEVGKNVADVTVTVPTSAKYTCEEVRIYNNNGDLQETETFQDKQAYHFEFYLEPVAGYDFAQGLEVVVDGEDIQRWDSQLTYAYVYKDYSFRTKLDKVELTVTEPVVGGNVADSVLKAPADAKYEVQYYWMDVATGEQVTDGTFLDKHKYELTFDLNAAEGYEFLEDAVVTINGKEVGGVWIQEYDLAYGWGWQTWSFMEKINKIAFPAFPAVNAGDSKELTLQAPNGANYTLMAMWQAMEDDGEAETLQNENVYMLIYYAEANEGYELAEDVVILVDGKEYIGLTDKADFNAMAAKTYSFGYPTVDKVEITVAKPENGAAPGEATAPEDVKYVIDYVEWFTNTSGEINDDADLFEAFQYGNYYYLTASVTAAEGYVLADDAEFYINGEKVEAVKFYSFGTYGMVAFDLGQLEEPAPTPTPTPTPDPSNPQTGDNAPLTAMVVLLVLAAAGMAVMCIGKKRFVK